MIRRRLTRFGILAILGVAVGALAFGPAFSLAQPEDPKEKKERGKDGPGGGFDRKKGDPDGPNREEIQKVREELRQATMTADVAISRVRYLKYRLGTLESPKDFPIVGAVGGMVGGIDGQERQLHEMQKQIEELRRVLDEMRTEMQRGNDRPTPKGPMPERKEIRPMPFSGGFPGRPGAEKGPEKLPAPPVKDD